MAEPEAVAPDVTGLLRAHAAGDGDALGRLLPRVYEELRRIARGGGPGRGDIQSLLLRLRRGPAAPPERGLDVLRGRASPLRTRCFT